MNVEALFFCFSMLASTSLWSICSKTFIHHYHIPLAVTKSVRPVTVIALEISLADRGVGHCGLKCGAV